MTGNRAPDPEPPLQPTLPPDLDEPFERGAQPWVSGATDDLKRKTAVSILWTVLRSGSDYLLSFLFFALLARRLGPYAFGIFVLAAAFAEFGRILPSTGLVNAIGRSKQVSPSMADTVFWATLLLAVLVAALMALVARPLAMAWGEPAVAPLLIALGLILPVAAAGQVHIALILREFGHKAMASRSVVSGVLGGIAALAAAWNGWGPWSLVVQRGVTEVAGTAMAWRAYRWVPGWRFSFSVLRDLAGFSTSITLTQLLFVSLARVQDMIIGRIIGAPAVGVYRTAWRTVELIAHAVILPFSAVSLPALARLQDDLPAFRRAYLRIVGVSASLAFPAIFGFAVIAPAAIPLLFGDQWTRSVGIAQVLGLLAVPFTLNYFASPALAALGHSGTLARLAGLQVILTIALSLAAAPFGLLAMAWAYVLRAYLVLPAQMWSLRRHCGLGYGAMLRTIAPALGVALIMVGALVGLDRVIGGWFPSRGTYVLGMTVSGALVYGSAFLLFARSFVEEQIRDIKRLLPDPPTKLSGAGA
jgi:O-antigen/teichoic acid export membrane protein